MDAYRIAMMKLKCAHVCCVEIARRQGFQSAIFFLEFIYKMHVLFLSTGSLEMQVDYLIAFCGSLAFPSHVH